MGTRKEEIAKRLSTALQRWLCDAVDEASLVRGLRGLARDIEGEKVLEAQKAREATIAPEVHSVFGWWKQKMNKPRALLTGSRARCIAARLKEGYTVAQLRLAVGACSASEWHQGANERKTPYNDISLICRSSEKVDQFLEMAATSGSGSDLAVDISVRRLQLEAARALREGRIDDYNYANARLRDSAG